MDIDGSNPKMLSRGGYFQDVSHDEQWVIFTPPIARLLKLPIDGGNRYQLAKHNGFVLIIASDELAIW
jgi:hypothetical protein